MDRSALRSNERIEGGKKGRRKRINEDRIRKVAAASRRCDLQRDRFERIYNNVTDVSKMKSKIKSIFRERINKINLFEKF